MHFILKAHKALMKRSTPPGQQHNKPVLIVQNQANITLQLREKQKVKRLYGLLEKQFSEL
jgi:ribosomal protein S4